MNARNLYFLSIVYFLFMFSPTAMSGQRSSQPTWNTVGGGLSGAVYTLISYGDDLYVGGNVIARWDGESWHPLGEDPLYGTVHDMVVYNGDLYLGGAFYSDKHPGIRLARWDGDSLHIVAGYEEINNLVRTLAVFKGDLYIGGVFENAAGLEDGDHIIRWDGDTFSSVGGGIKNIGHWVTALAADEENLYVGGAFGEAGNTHANNIARWDGTNWHSLDGGWNGAEFGVWSLAISGQYLYVGGDGGPANHDACGIARWNGSQWEEVGGGLSHCAEYEGARTLEVIGDSLFVGGIFEQAGGTPYTSQFAGYNGHEWFTLGEPTGDPYSYLFESGGAILAIHAHQQDLYIGGAISIDSLEGADNILRWGLPALTSFVTEPDLKTIPIQVSPNVTNGHFTYDFGYTDTKHTLKIFDILGNKLYSETKSDMAGNIEYLPAGMYIVRIEKDDLYGVTLINKN